MKRVSTLDLIAQTETLDAIGQPVMSETRRTVYGTLQTVTRSEWAAAQQQALAPSFCIKVFFADYNGEKIAEYSGGRYVIYRTYGAEDYIELYLGTRVGEISG